MKIITTFIVSCLFFGSAFAGQNEQMPESSFFSPDCPFQLDPSQGWVANDFGDEIFAGLAFENMGLEPPLSFFFERENEEESLFEVMGAVILRCGDAALARQTVQQLKTVFIPTQTSENGFEARMGPGLISYTAYGPNILMILYMPDQDNKNILEDWREIQDSIQITPPSSR